MMECEKCLELQRLLVLEEDNKHLHAELKQVKDKNEELCSILESFGKQITKPSEWSGGKTLKEWVVYFRDLAKDQAAEIKELKRIIEDCMIYKDEIGESVIFAAEQALKGK